MRAPEPSPSPLLPDDLVNACKAGECVLYAGSGLSAQAGLQTYLPMVSDLLGWALEHGFVDPSFAQSLEEALQQGDTDLVADSLVSVLGGDRREALTGYLRDAFHRPPSLPAAHALLREIPFCAALSTNFDDLLEWTFEPVDQTVQPYTPLDAERLLAALTKRDFFLLKLYGTLELPETVLIAPAQYQEVVAGNLGFSRFMESLFHSRTLLFLGASLEGILSYLQGLKFGQVSRPHYALVDVTGSAWRAKADLLKRRYGIEVLPFMASPGFPEFTDFIARLRGPASSPGSGEERWPSPPKRRTSGPSGCGGSCSRTSARSSTRRSTSATLDPPARQQRRRQVEHPAGHRDRALRRRREELRGPGRRAGGRRGTRSPRGRSPWKSFRRSTARRWSRPIRPPSCSARTARAPRCGRCPPCPWRRRAGSPSASRRCAC